MQEEHSLGAGGGGGGDADGDIDWRITSLIFLFPALAGALFGYDIGATSGALVSLTSATTSGTDWCEGLSGRRIAAAALLFCAAVSVIRVCHKGWRVPSGSPFPAAAATAPI